MSPMNKYNQHSGVEVLETEDLWAQFGSKLPEKIPKLKKQRAIPWRRLAVCGAGVVFTVALHLLLLGSILLGTAGHKPVAPRAEGAAASAQNSDASEFVSTILLLDSHSITSLHEASDESAYMVLQALEQQPKDAVIIASLDQIPVPEISGSDTGTDADSSTTEATGNEEGRAMMFGRYMGQVKARIERAWEYPPAASVSKFACKVQIKQNHKGDVQEVTLQRCGDDPAWQTSLVQAIQQASPLSAPPNESVFSEVLTLSFDAETAL